MKRHRDDEYIQKKIRKLEKKLSKQKEKLTATKNPSVQCSEDEALLQVDGTPTLPAMEQDITLEAGTSTKETTENELEFNAEPETPQLEEILPEEFLLALGEEGKVDEEKGQNIRPEIADRWTNIIKMGIKKDNLSKLLQKYPTPANFPLANAPKLNSEMIAAVSETVIKRDKKFEYRQNLTGRVLSCLGGMLTDIMKGNLNSLKLIEGLNDAAKILCNMNHYESLTRRHFILTSVQSSVKQAIADVPADTFLFGENFGEHLRLAKAVERSGSTIKQPQKKPNFRHQPSTSKNLNWKSPSQRPPVKNYNFRGGPKNHQQMKRSYKPQQAKPPRRH